MTVFVHTADWHLGKPYASIRDDEGRALVRQARFDALEQVARAATEAGAAFVAVAGDLFDSPTPDRSTVSAALSAIGGIGVPVYVIPGNHDHAGPGAVWEQEFFRREREVLAPGLRILTEPRPVEAEGAVILPAPLLHRQLASDPTAWIRSTNAFPGDGVLPRIVLAHGSVQDFGGRREGAEPTRSQPNLIQVERLPMEEIDYVALGDWHGTREIREKVWYPGTPEPDRFAKGEDHRQGRVLVVEVDRGGAPVVRPVETGVLGWHAVGARLDSGGDVKALGETMSEHIGGRARKDLVRLELEGALGLADRRRLDELIESLRSRLLELRVEDRVRLAPDGSELRTLTQGEADPLIARVASRLLATLESGTEDAPVVEASLRELYLVAEEAS